VQDFARLVAQDPESPNVFVKLQPCGVGDCASQRHQQSNFSAFHSALLVPIWRRPGRMKGIVGHVHVEDRTMESRWMEARAIPGLAERLDAAARARADRWRTY